MDASLPSQARVSSRLLDKRKLKETQEKDSTTTSTTPSKRARPPTELCHLSPAALRQRLHREKLKADSQKYEAYLEKERERFRQIRKNWTPEKKADKNKASNERSRKSRALKKEQGLPLSDKKSKPSTRAAVLEHREKERLRKQAYRQRLSGHQKAWINKETRCQGKEEA